MQSTMKFLIAWFCWISVNPSYLSSALRDVRVTIPPAVKSGDNTVLMCHYDLEQDNLYSIKWYKGNREFYRYTPRENPPMKVFGSVAGIKVRLDMSNASTVLLTSVEPANSGKYSCEVSADAPSFHTVIESADLQVVELPQFGPTINYPERVYSFGDILMANCTLSSIRRPLFNLSWIVNNHTAHHHQVIQFNLSKDDSSNLETASVGLKLVLQPKHFRSKFLRLMCKANIYDIFESTTTKIIELDSTSNQILADDFNTFGNAHHMFDYDNDDDDEDYLRPPRPGNDIRMHHIKAPDIISRGTGVVKVNTLLILCPGTLSSLVNLTKTAIAILAQFLRLHGIRLFRSFALKSNILRESNLILTEATTTKATKKLQQFQS